MAADAAVLRRTARRRDFLTHRGGHAAGPAHAYADRASAPRPTGARMPLKLTVPPLSDMTGSTTAGRETDPDPAWMPPKPPPHLDEKTTMDPSTPLSVLWTIARERPDLRRWLIVNPSAPPELLEYIAQEGGPGVGQGLRVLFTALDTLGQHHRAREVMPAMLRADSADLDAALRRRDAPMAIERNTDGGTGHGPYGMWLSPPTSSGGGHTGENVPTTTSPMSVGQSPSAAW